LAALAILWVVIPVGIGVLVGALLALTIYSSYRALARKTGRPAFVALGATILVTVLVTGAVVALVYLLILKGVAVVSALPPSLAPGGPAARLVDQLAAPLAILKLQPTDIADKVRGALGTITAFLAGWAAQVAGMIFDGLLGLFFMALTMYFVLRHWREFAKRAEHMLPINPHHTRRLMRELQRLGRQTVIGNFGTGIIQGIIAGVGYAIGHVPQAAFLGAMTAVASLLPAVGTMLVWLPAALVLLFGGHTGAGLFVLIWGAFAVVAFCDYVVRPRLVGRGETMSTWMMFVALFGGIKLFGVVGLLLGPLLVGLAVAALDLYERTRKFRLKLS
jgi:predicted PurR-regulated permease PerM